LSNFAKTGFFTEFPLNPIISNLSIDLILSTIENPFNDFPYSQTAKILLSERAIISAFALFVSFSYVQSLNKYSYLKAVCFEEL